MPLRSNPHQTSDRIPEDYAHRIISEIENYSKHEDFRKKIKEVVEECMDSVPFMDKVRGYAKRELDERIFKNGFTILIWIVSVLGAALLGGVITKYVLK